MATIRDTPELRLLSPLELRAWRGMLRAQAALAKALDAQLEAAHGLQLSSYEVLMYLADAEDERMRMCDLASTVLLSRSGLTRLVDRLEAAGLLRREAATDDRRGAYAVLTDEGRAAQLRAWPIYARGIATHFAGHLSEEEAMILANALQRISAATPST